MRKRLIILALAVVAVAAQVAAPPIPVDFRYTLTWTDPNPPGAAIAWLVHATNTASIRSAGTMTTNCAIATLLNGAPAGTYTVYTTAVSALGVEGDPGDIITLTWPGGNGKLRGGVKLNAIK